MLTAGSIGIIRIVVGSMCSSELLAVTLLGDSQKCPWLTRAGTGLYLLESGACSRVTYRGVAHHSLAPTVELRAKGRYFWSLPAEEVHAPLEYFGYAGVMDSLRTMRMHSAAYRLEAGNASLLGSAVGYCLLHCVGATASCVPLEFSHL